MISLSTSTKKVAVLDMEPTGLDPAADELVKLVVGLCTIESDTGHLLSVDGIYSGWRQPSHLTPLAEQILGRTAESLSGATLDHERLRQLLLTADILVSHNASFDRNFVLPILPWLSTVPWRCSKQDIDWRSRLSVASLSLDRLLDAAGCPPSDGTIEGDVYSLLQLLTHGPSPAIRVLLS